MKTIATLLLALLVSAFAFADDQKKESVPVKEAPPVATVTVAVNTLSSEIKKRESVFCHTKTTYHIAKPYAKCNAWKF